MARTGNKIQNNPRLRGFDPAYLALLCKPKTVIDVGVGFGTRPLYEAFPVAKFILVEPLREYQKAIGEIMNKYDCEVIYKAVGSHSGEEEINVESGDPHKSSFRDRTELTKTGNPVKKRLVEVTTLDSVFAERNGIEKPILLKIDAEGHELDILKGSVSLLDETEIVIAEVSIANRFEAGYQFEDIIFFMKAHGFYLFTFLKIVHVEGELRPRFADVVFKRCDP